MNEALQSIVDSLSGLIQPLLDQFGSESSAEILDGLTDGEAAPEQPGDGDDAPEGGDGDDAGETGASGIQTAGA